jgi:hypothetical protein
MKLLQDHEYSEFCKERLRLLRLLYPNIRFQGEGPYEVTAMENGKLTVYFTASPGKSRELGKSLSGCGVEKVQLGLYLGIDSYRHYADD